MLILFDRPSEMGDEVFGGVKVGDGKLFMIQVRLVPFSDSTQMIVVSFSGLLLVDLGLLVSNLLFLLADHELETSGLVVRKSMSPLQTLDLFFWGINPVFGDLCSSLLIHSLSLIPSPLQSKSKTIAFTMPRHLTCSTHSRKEQVKFAEKYWGSARWA